MNRKHKTLLSLILIFSLSLSQLLAPPPVEARLRNPFKALWKGITKTSHFVVKLPQKITRPLGPVLGPVALFVLTKNIGQHQHLGKIFHHAQKVQQIRQTEQEIQKSLGDVRGMYREEANKLYAQADELSQLRDQLQQNLLKPGATYADYKNKVVEIDKLIDMHHQLAEEMLTAADNFRTQDVVNILGKSLLSQVGRQIKQIATQEVSQELQKLINPNIIATLIGQDSSTVPTLIDLLVAGDLNRVLEAGNYGDHIDLDDLKARIRDQIKAMLKENKDAFKKNWKDQIDAIIKDQIALIQESEKFREDNQPQEEKQVGQVAKKEETKSTSKVVEDFEFSLIMGVELQSDKCPQGYEYKPSYGVDCVQYNCFDVSGAHLGSTGHCICGSVGSLGYNPDDLNKICKTGPDYKACPNCTFACVGEQADCPQPPK